MLKDTTMLPSGRLQHQPYRYVPSLDWQLQYVTTGAIVQEQLVAAERDGLS